jgi:hypothetical protein
MRAQQGQGLQVDAQLRYINGNYGFSLYTWHKSWKDTTFVTRHALCLLEYCHPKDKHSAVMVRWHYTADT